MYMLVIEQCLGSNLLSPCTSEMCPAGRDIPLTFVSSCWLSRGTTSLHVISLVTCKSCDFAVLAPSW